jgi:hypothetical protein
MIIDVHGHLGPWFFGPDRGTVSDNLAVMDTHGIDIQLVSGVEAVTYDPIAGNRTLPRRRPAATTRRTVRHRPP